MLCPMFLADPLTAGQGAKKGRGLLRYSVRLCGFCHVTVIRFLVASHDSHVSESVLFTECSRQAAVTSKLKQFFYIFWWTLGTSVCMFRFTYLSIKIFGG